jgi:hypothetical protein
VRDHSGVEKSGARGCAVINTIEKRKRGVPGFKARAWFSGPLSNLDPDLVAPDLAAELVDGLAAHGGATAGVELEPPAV